MAKELKFITSGRVPAKSRMIAFWATFVTLAMLPFSNCSSNHELGSSYGTPSSSSINGIDTQSILSSLQAEKDVIFNNNCVSCHNSATTDNPLHDLSNTNALVASGYIVKGSPQTSPLYTKLVDGVMPKAPNPTLSTTDIDVIRDWIAAEGGNFNTLIGGQPIDTGGGTTTAATFANVRTVLNQNCTSCHNGAQAPNLTGDITALKAQIVKGMPLVTANNTSSPLLTSFATMPPNNPLGLNSAAANTVRSWIQAGAK